MNERLKFCVYPHHHLDWTQRAPQDDPHALHIADGDALKIYRLALAYAFSIVKISNQGDFFGEKAARPADQEDEKGQGRGTDNYGYSDL
jgi:hypothetical protein